MVEVLFGNLFMQSARGTKSIYRHLKPRLFMWDARRTAAKRAQAELLLRVGPCR
jgi:hypothetical protein